MGRRSLLEFPPRDLQQTYIRASCGAVVNSIYGTTRYIALLFRLSLLVCILPCWYFSGQLFCTHEARGQFRGYCVHSLLVTTGY